MDMNPIEEEDEDNIPEDTIQRYKATMMSMSRKTNAVKFEDEEEDEFNQRGSNIAPSWVQNKKIAYSNPWDLDVMGRGKNNQKPVESEMDIKIEEQLEKFNQQSLKNLSINGPQQSQSPKMGNPSKIKGKAKK